MKNKQLEKKVKALQKAFNDEDFILRLLQTKDDFWEKRRTFRDMFAKVFEYYLCTEDKNHTYSYDEIQNKFYEIYGNGEMIDQRYYFQAYNGCCEESYRKNGLDDISGMNPKIIEALELLENELGKTTKGTSGKINEFHRSYVTASAEMLMRYALDFSPERLWYGPLNEVGTAVNSGKTVKTSIRIGEKKSDYIMRIIEGKIEGMSEEKKEQIRKAGRIVADAYGSKRPRIAIIPESGIREQRADYNSHASFLTNLPNTTIGELAELENPDWIYTLSSGPNFGSEGGIVVYGGITPEKFKSISIPDSYELLQMYAIQRGANFGDLIDPYTGDIRMRAQEQYLEDNKNTRRLIGKILERLKPIKKKEVAREEKYEDFGQIYLGGTGEMHLCKDAAGKEYLFKPSFRKGTKQYEAFRADIQVVASRLQHIISPETAVKCELVEIDGLKGTIQPKIKTDEEKTDSLRRYYYENGALDENIARQFMREYIVDYCLVNYDSHYRNFIVDERGNLRGVDKEQCLKHMNDYETKGDKRLDQYHPNAKYGEAPPIYGKIFADIEAGKISKNILKEAKIAIERIRKIPRNEYLAIFAPYAESLGYRGSQLDKFNNQIMNRFDSLSEIEAMIDGIYQPRSSLTELSQKLKKLEIQLRNKIMSRGKQKDPDNEKEDKDNSEI